MWCVRRPLIAGLLVLSVIGLEAAQAAGGRSPAEVSAHRQESLDDILSPNFEPALVANERRRCVSGGEPAYVAESRAIDLYFIPDAADACVAILTRTARDGRLFDLYRVLLTDAGGDASGQDRLPRAIGAAVLAGSSSVPVGNYKAMTVTPAISLDAGFAVAYQEGSAARPVAADLQRLKAVAEACLSQRQDVGACFSVGYIYGARAFAARPLPR